MGASAGHNLLLRHLCLTAIDVAISIYECAHPWQTCCLHVTATTVFLAPDFLHKCGRAPPHSLGRTRENDQAVARLSPSTVLMRWDCHQHRRKRGATVLSTMALGAQAVIPQCSDTRPIPLIPITRAAPLDRSMHRPFTNGPRSFIRTVTLRPVEYEVTVT